MTRRLLAAAFLLATGAAMAQDTGVPACDSFLRDYEACVSGQVPEAQRPTFRQALDQSRATLRQAATDPQTRAQLETMCQQQKVGMSQALQPFGCRFN
ncbi:hypothetical protein [Phreatobacter sp.]|uniref:hypothetical protein n=1 Tax=Phreatobacter sp. TaxID=1966341 RepID=UPI003F6E52C6